MNICQRISRFTVIPVLFFLLVYALVLASCSKGHEPPLLNQRQIDSIFTPTKEQLAKHDFHRAIALIDSICKAQKYRTDQLDMVRYSFYASFYQLMNKRDSAILFADSSAIIADRHPMTDSAWLRYSFSRHFNKANLLYAYGRVQPAIDEFFKAKDKVEKTGEECHADLIYHLIGLAMYQQQRYTAARSYFVHTLKIFDKCQPPGRSGYDYGRQEMLNNIAQCDEKLGRYVSARLYCQKALAQIGRSESLQAYNLNPRYNKEAADRNRGVVYGTIAQILYKSGHPDSAEVFFNRSLQLTNKQVGDIGDAQLTQVNLADLYFHQKQYPLLKNTLDSLGKSLRKQYSEEAQLGWLRLMYQYASINHLLVQELGYYKRYIAMRDSIAIVKKEKRETDLNEELNTRSQRLEISLLKKDNQLGRVYLWIVLSVSLLALAIIVLVLYNYRRSRRNVKILTGLNDQIGKQKTALEQANKDKDRILNVVAHDLRSPVGATAYLADMMLMADEVDTRAAKSLGLIKQAAKNALELINELLGLRADDVKAVKERVDLNQLITGAIEMLRYKASEKRQQMVFQTAEPVLQVMAVPERLTRLIGNLIINAIKFSHQETQIELTAAIMGDWVEFTVADQGIGIPEYLQADIFDTFTAARQQGTSGERSFGLGLSICKQIAAEHGGYITFKSKPGIGTVFTVKLPLCNDI
ncbi:MAG: tetratricopeptide repeat-containing sensor histidine kinase [Bacteroidota bacterium]